jgi:alkylated DNA nucleotide flippase Atl1
MGLLVNLPVGWRLQFLINSPDITADRAAKKPMLNAVLLGERQYASLNIPTLRACKRAHGHVGSHIDEKVGTHDDRPFFRVVRAARQGAPHQRTGSGQKAMAEGITVGARNLLNLRKTITMSYQKNAKRSASSEA